MGLKAMFVDIGFEKNAFLHFWDAIPAALDSGIEEIDRPGEQAAAKTDHSQGYSEHLSGRLRRHRAGDKGTDREQKARASLRTSVLPGVILCSCRSAIAAASRARLKIRRNANACAKFCGELEIPDGIGVIIRTVGEGQRARYFVRDLRFLLDQWAKVEQ